MLLSLDVINDSPTNIRIPSKGNLIGVIDILDELHIEFDIIIHSWSTSGSQWTNILHFANTAEEYYPALYFDVSRQCCFYMRFSSIQDSQRSWASPEAQKFNLNTKYNIKFTITQTSVSFMIDNQIIASEPILSHAILFNRNIYISSPLFASYDALDSTLYGLKVTTSISTIPYNYLCDYPNRFTTTTGTWIYDSNTCKLTQTDILHYHAQILMDKNDTTSLAWTDYTLITQFIIHTNNNSNGLPDAGPIFRATPSDNFFRIFGEVGAGGDVGFQTSTSGSRSTQQRTIWPLTFETTHKFTVVASGCSFNIYLDDILRIQRTDCTYTTGTVGFATYEAEVDILSFNVIFPNNGQLYTAVPSNAPTQPPTNYPTPAPTEYPTPAPTEFPTPAPTIDPTSAPSNYPSFAPSNTPSQPPSNFPSFTPTIPPTNVPSVPPSFSPSMYPSITPTFTPTISPSKAPITPTDAIEGGIEDIVTSQNNGYNYKGKDANINSGNNAFVYDIRILIGMGCLIIICCIIVCLLLYLVRSKKNKRMNKHLKSKSLSTDTTDEMQLEMQQTDFKSGEARKVTDFDIDNVKELPDNSSEYDNSQKLNEFVTPIGPIGIDHVETIGRLQTSEELIPNMGLMNTQIENETDFDDMYEPQTAMNNNKTPIGPMGDNNIVTPQ